MSDDMQRTAPGVTFLTSEQKIWGDCGLGNFHNQRYLIKLVNFVFSFEATKFFVTNWNAIAMQLRPKL